jgi:four helix bundle protein
VGKQRRANAIQDKNFAFELKIVLFCRTLRLEQKEFVLSKQLLRSGTSIGANVEEGLGAYSKKEFAAKMAIAAKEARGTLYWLRLLRAADLLERGNCDMLMSECRELLAILNSIILTTRRRLQTEPARSHPTIQHSEFRIQNFTDPSEVSHDFPDICL